MVMPRLDLGRYLGEHEYAERIEAAVSNRIVGGFCVFNGAASDAKQVISKLRAIHPQEHLLFSIDAEWGATMRLRGDVTEFPHARAIAESSFPRAAYLSGLAIGSELKAIGIDWDFAPVLDINSDPDNPIINIRSFAEDSDTVITNASEFIRGLTESRVLTSGKHFPGHGETKTDSHNSLPVLDVTPEVFASRELVPFIAIIDKGISSIMTGHLAAPKLARSLGASDEEAMLAATLSPFLIQKLLREKLGYNGVVVTDSLEMASVKALTGSDAVSCELAVRAGCDMLLMPTEFEESYRHLCSLAAHDSAFAGLVERSSARIASFISRIQDKKTEYSLEDHRELSFSIAKGAINVKGNIEHLSRIRRVVLATNDPSGQKRLDLLREELQRIMPEMLVVSESELTVENRGSSAIIYAQRPIGKLVDGETSKGNATEFLSRYRGMVSCIILLGNPYLSKNLSVSDTCIVRTFSDSVPSIQALAAFLAEARK